MPQSLTANLSFKENVNVAYDNSFIEVKNSVRPLYAQATYITNASDMSVSLSAGSLSIDNTAVVNALNTIQTQLNALTTIQNRLIPLTALYNQLFSLSAIQGQLIALSAINPQLYSLTGIDTKINSLTSIESRLIPLTALYSSNFNLSSIQAQLIPLTAINSQLYSLTSIQNQVNSLSSIPTQLVPLTAVRNVPGFSIPEYDQIDMEYVPTTDILRRVYYKKNTTQVMSLSFGYVTEPPTSTNQVIKSIIKL